MKCSLRLGLKQVLLGSILICCLQASGANFSGKVFCPNNNPLASADVSVYRMDADASEGMIAARLVGKAVTDNRGEFKIATDIAADSSDNMGIFCIAGRKDYSFTWAMSIGAGDTEYNLHLCLPQSISGRIIDSQEKPVADAVVRAIVLTLPVKDSQNQMPNMLLNLEPMSLFTAVSDSEGRFEIKDLPDSASMEFLITRPGMGTLITASSDMNPASSYHYAVGQKDIVLTLSKGLTVSGKVLDSQDKAIADATVMIMPKESPVNLLAKPVKTDSEGSYRFADLAGGEYRISMQSPSGDSASEKIDLQQDMSVQLKAKKGSWVEIKVVDDTEKPVENANVLLYQNGQMPIQGKTDAQGILKKKAQAGTYSLQVYGAGMRQPKHTEITVNEDQTYQTTITLAGSAKITGLVTSSKGEAIVGTEVKILPDNGGMKSAIKTDSKGRYTLSWSPEDMSWTEGRFLLVAINRDTKEGIAADIDTETKEMNLQLKPTITITGKVMNEKNEPIAKAMLSVQIGTSRWSSHLDSKSIQTDSKGRLTLDCLPVDAKYSFNVTGPDGYGTAYINPEEPMDGSTLNIKVKDTILKVADKSVSGKAVDADGKPLEGAQISCYGDGQPNLNVKSDKDGKFTLSPVCEGMVQINAHYNKNNQWMYANITAQAGETEVELVIMPEGNSGRRAVPKPKPLVDKTLPQVLTDPNQFDGKPLLICIWDYRQRPSRYGVGQLAQQKDLLNGRGIPVVLLQGEPMDKAAIDGWLKEKNIDFISDMIAADADKKRFEMGVQSLPWMILTDKTRKVLAEGFDVHEINTVLEKVK
jgi:uncharacterized GH25 family protein